MLEALFAWQDDPGRCGEDLDVRIAGLVEAGNDYLLTITGRGEGSEVSSRWRIRAHAVRGGRITLSEIASRVEVTDAHPLLLPHTARRTEVFVRRAPEDPLRLLGDLWRAHDRLTGGWIRTDAYLNAGYGLLSGSIDGGFGQLAAGPRPILEAYADVARAHGMEPTLLGDHPPARWDGTRFIEQTSPLHVLMVGESWCVAEQYTCEQGDADAES